MSFRPRLAHGGFRDRGHARSDLRPLPPQGIPAKRAEFHAAPARVLQGTRHELLHGKFQHRFAGLAAQATAPSRSLGMRISLKSKVQSLKSEASGFVWACTF